MRALKRAFVWLKRKALICAAVVVTIAGGCLMGVENMGKFRYVPTLGNLVYGTGELPELPEFTAGIVLIAAAGTAILALAVGIVIYRRLKSVIR